MNSVCAAKNSNDTPSWSLPRCSWPYYHLNIDPNYYFAGGGTLIATPQVAGVIALMKQVYPFLTPFEVKTIIKNSATDSGYYPGYYQGAGVLNAKRAINETFYIAFERGFKPHPHPPTCGNNRCEEGEYFGNCCKDFMQGSGDCFCPFGTICNAQTNTCETMDYLCGDGICNASAGENYSNCCYDCRNNLNDNYQCTSTDIYDPFELSCPTESAIKKERILSPPLKYGPKTVNITGTRLSENWLYLEGNMYPGRVSYCYPRTANGLSFSSEGGYMYGTLYIKYLNESWITWPKQTFPQAISQEFNNPINNNIIFTFDTRQLADSDYGAYKAKISLDKREAKWGVLGRVFSNGSDINSSEVFLPNINNDYLSEINPSYITIGNNLEVYGSIRNPDNENTASVIIDYGKATGSCYTSYPENVTQWSILGVQSLHNNSEIWLNKIADINTSYMDNSGCYIIRMRVTKTSVYGTFTNIDYVKVQVSPAATLSWPTKRLSNQVISKTKVGYRVNILGTVRVQRLERYEILWKKQGTSEWRSEGISLVNGGRSRISGTLGTWDLRNFEQGEYDVKLKTTYLSYSGQQIIVEDTGTLTVEFVPSVINNTGNNAISGYLVCNIRKAPDYHIITNTLVNDSLSQQRIILGHNYLSLAQAVNTKMSQFNTNNLDTGTYMLMCWLATRPNGSYDEAVGVKDEYGRLRYLRDFDFFEIVSEDPAKKEISVTGDAIKDINLKSSNFFNKIKDFFTKLF